MKYRDPQTGEFKDITVKVSDTLPIGAEVDYDGTTVPSGWEKVSNDSGILILNTSPEVRYRKIGNVCMLIIRTYSSVTINAFALLKLGTLPENFRPVFTARVPVNVKSANSESLDGIILEIDNSTGSVTLTNWTSTSRNIGAIESGFTYLTANDNVVTTTNTSTTSDEPTSEEATI